MIHRNSPTSSAAPIVEDTGSLITKQAEADDITTPSTTEKQKKGVYSSSKKKRIKRLLDSDSEKRSGTKKNVFYYDKKYVCQGKKIFLSDYWYSTTWNYISLKFFKYSLVGDFPTPKPSTSKTYTI